MGDINYLLVAVVIALIVGCIKGYNKGLLRISVSLAGLILVVVVATKVAPFVNQTLVSNTNLYENVRQKIITIYSEQNSRRDNTVEENQKTTINSYNLPDILSGDLLSNNTSEMYNKLAASLFEEYISGYLARIVIKAGSFCGSFVALGIIMLMILGAIKILEKIPVLKTINRVLGLVAGCGMSLIFIWIFFIGAMMFFANSVGGWMFLQIKNSSVLSFLFNNNLLFQWLLS